jgi:outer membrane protein assembly factor BamD
MRPRHLPVVAALLLLAGVMILSACGSKDKVKNDAKGRPDELYTDAMTKLRKGHYDEARLLFNVVINTYPDSEYLPLAKLATADSFYREGGSTALEQAIGGYKEFAQYFPTHPLACEVKLKIAEAYMRQMNAFNRDWTKAKQAEFQLQATLQTCQNSPLKPEINERLTQVQQVMGMHELDIGNFYFGPTRRAYKAAAGRYEDIIKNYPYFTYRDEALFKAGVSLIEQEQPEEASQYFTDLVRNIPHSEYVKDAKAYLEKLGKPIPEPANDNPAPPRPGMVGNVKLVLGMNDLTISRAGVLINEDGDVKQETLDRVQKPTDTTPGQTIRATTKGTALAPTTNAPPTSQPDAATTSDTSRPRTTTGTSSESTTQPTSADPKKPQKKKKGN